MRLLVLYQARDAVRDHPGYYDGFQRLTAEGILDAHVGIAYYGVAEARGWEALWSEAYNEARNLEADAIFLQFFHGLIPEPWEGIQRLKDLPWHPLVFSSVGDGYGRWTKRIPVSSIIASQLSDLTFLTGMGYLAHQLAREGSRNLVLMPHGCCQVRFSAPLDRSTYHPEFDLVFIGSRIISRNPLSHFFWVGRQREAFVSAMTRRYGRRFALFGRGWDGNPSWAGPVAYGDQHKTYQLGAVALGGMPNAYYDYYMSDRPFIAAASGVPFVDYWLPGTDHVLLPGRDCWWARDLAEVIKSCDRLLDLTESERLDRACEARRRVLSAHTQYHRCREMVQIADRLRASRLRGARSPVPELNFLSGKGAVELGGVPAIVRWQG